MKKLILIAILLTSCKDSQKAQWRSLGMRHSVKLYAAGGNLIQEWTATGNVSNESNSDGWYFEDEKTHRLVEITGTIIITVIL